MIWKPSLGDQESQAKKGKKPRKNIIYYNTNYTSNKKLNNATDIVTFSKTMKIFIGIYRRTSVTVIKSKF